jgi:hypothetical protein
MTLAYQPNTYLAFELSPTTRGWLLNMFPPKFSRVVCHHITVAFSFNEQQFNEIIKQLGEQPTFMAVGYLADKSLECIAVSLVQPGQSSQPGNASERPLGGYYHITHSLERDRKPVDSNKLLVASHGKPDELIYPQGLLRGRLRLLPR